MGESEVVGVRLWVLIGRMEEIEKEIGGEQSIRAEQCSLSDFIGFYPAGQTESAII